MIRNNVTLLGNLGSDINLRSTQTGQSVGTVSIAVSRTYRSKAGDTVEDTNWFSLVAWATIAERMDKVLSKGSRVLVEGRLQARSYEAKDGTKRNVVEVNVTSFELIGRTTERSTYATAEPHNDVVAETVSSEEAVEPLPF